MFYYVVFGGGWEKNLIAERRFDEGWDFFLHARRPNARRLRFTHLDDADLEGAFLSELGVVFLEEIAGHVRLGEGEGTAGEGGKGEETERYLDRQLNRSDRYRERQKFVERVGQIKILQKNETTMTYARVRPFALRERRKRRVKNSSRPRLAHDMLTCRGCQS